MNAALYTMKKGIERSLSVITSIALEILNFVWKHVSDSFVNEINTSILVKAVFFVIFEADMAVTMKIAVF
jgi:hypothetical protein